VPSLCDLLLKHLFVVSKQELKPVALSICLNFNAKIVVNRLILLINVGVEVKGAVVKLILLLKGLEELVDL
jgi:hypothetical protein